MTTPAAPTPSSPAAPTPSTTSPAPSPAPTTTWHRFHPITPVLKSWRVLAVLLVVYGQQRGEDVVRSAGPGRPGGTELLIALGSLVAAVLLSIAVSALSWRVTTYAIDAEAVRLHSGLLSRRQRAARLDRLQAVDVAQPVLARLTGFAEVRVEVAGGSGSDIRLGYLREADAQALRNTLLARSAGLTYDGEAPEASERLVVEVPLGRLAASILLCPETLWLVVIVVGLLVTSVVLGTAAPVFGALAPMIALLGAVWRRFSTAVSWQVSVAGDGLRVRHGLLGTQSQTVLPGRVQAVRVSQPLLWRPGGWWSVHANVAGYSSDGANDASGDKHLLLPVATRAEAEAVLGLVLPQWPQDGLASGLVGTGEAGGWTASPPRARRLDPFAWRRNGVRVAPEALLVRRGRARRQLDVVPHERTQSLGLAQGPWQRRLHLVNFTLHSTRGPVSPVARHLDAATAARLLEHQADRARSARAVAGPERWMEVTTS